MRKWGVVVLTAFGQVFACSGDDQPAPTPEPPGTTIDDVYQLDEGATLDLLIDAPAGASVNLTTNLPNATLAGQVFTFHPDYTQAGLHTFDFSIADDSSTTTKTIAVRVFNVIHAMPVAPITVAEGVAAPTQTFTSNDPAGTIVSFHTDLTAVPGATFDAATGKLDFKPSIRWLDAHGPQVVITVTAEGLELDSGRWDTTTYDVVYSITEVTSFSEEILPIFANPIGGAGPPDQQTFEGHNCVQCHDGSAGSPAGMDLHPSTAYAALVNHDISVDGIVGSTCHSLAASGVKQVVPNMPAKSLLYMKMSGTDGGTGTTVPCGVQMSSNNSAYYVTVTDQDAWNLCPNDTCRQSLLCSSASLSCKTDARYVRKLRVWIAAGAPNN